MHKWILVSALLLIAAACSPAAAPTPTPVKTTPPPAATAAKPAAEPTKPVAAATAASKPAVEPTKPVAAATAASKPAVKPLSPAVTVKVGVIGTTADSFIYIADAKRYFADEGLNVDMAVFSTGGLLVAPLGTGDLDVGGGSPSPGLFNAISRGIPIKIVGDRYASKPGQQAMFGMTVRKDLIDSGAIKDYKDLKGKTIAINAAGSSTEITMEKALEKGGVKRDEVKVVVLAFPDMVAALANKAVDVTVLTEPSIAQAVDSGIGVRWKGEDEIYPNHNTSVLVYGPKFYQNNPEAAKRFMVAYVRAFRDYINAFTKNVNRKEIVDILVKSTNVKDPTMYDKMAPLTLNPDGYVNAQSIASDQDWYFSTGVMPQKVDLSKVIDNQYVDYAIERLGKYQP